MLRMIATILLLGCSVWDGMAGEPDSLTKRGRILAKEMCAGCHAIGNSGQSPHVGVPAFRALDRRADFDQERQIVSVANLTRQDATEFFGIVPKAGIVAETGHIPWRGRMRPCRTSGLATCKARLCSFHNWLKRPR
jgi:hypothetical protein